MSDSSPLVELTQTGIYRDGRWLVRHIDLSVHAGEIITLIGPNGSGKSTIARLALGLLKPDEGQSHLKKSVQLAYMPQNLTLDWTLPLTVKRLMSLTSRPSKSEITKALTQTGSEHLADKSINLLSGGELQRVLLARALIRKPDFLVLDEPVKGVDIVSEASMYELIATIRDELGCGILLISHDLHIVMAKSDRVICINGHICCEGTPERVAKSAEYLTLFNRSAPMALYQHDHNHVHLPDGRVVEQEKKNKND